MNKLDNVFFFEPFSKLVCFSFFFRVLQKLLEVKPASVCNKWELGLLQIQEIAIQLSSAKAFRFSRRIIPAFLKKHSIAMASTWILASGLFRGNPNLSVFWRSWQKTSMPRSWLSWLARLKPARFREWIEISGSVFLCRSCSRIFISNTNGYSVTEDYKY